MTLSSEARAQAQDLLHFIDASPSPWHAVHSIEQRLLAQGFMELQEVERWLGPYLNYDPNDAKTVAPAARIACACGQPH